MRTALRFLLPALLLSACAPHDEGIGIDEEIVPAQNVDEKADNAGRKGPLVATNTTLTQVWTASNKWEDRDTAEAKKAGLAWGENSGLNWDEKYARWIDTMEEVEGINGYRTVKIKTPWGGKELPAPSLECSEAAMMFRATFAAWYKLPFFLEAGSASAGRIFFGHFGIRTAAGKYSNTPNFATAYKDYSTLTEAQLAAQGWPKDPALRARRADGGEDNQPAINEATAGAYMDELHLNKRAGHLIIYLLNYHYSGSLASTANTFNLKPDAIRSGDLLIHRWQSNGIGDVKLVKNVDQAEGKLAVELISGSMPRRQPKIYDPVSSKGYLMSEDTGGVGTNSDGVKYFKLGGGLKRFRVTKNLGGYWTNTWMQADEANWINSDNEAAITARPEQFGELLDEVSPEEKREALLRHIADARSHLLNYPASCGARDRREHAFESLYAIAPQLGMTKAQIDAQYRKLEDYVFASLVYSQSKTCCWNSSTSAMAAIVMDYARKEQASQCIAPTVFKNENGGYQRWANHAAALNQAAAWKAWTEDESCSQRGTQNDVVNSDLDAETAYCSLPADSNATCDYGTNGSVAMAATLGSTQVSAHVCSGGDNDYYKVYVQNGRSLSVTVRFTHSAGDLDVELLSSSGQRVSSSESTSDVETVSGSNLVAGYYYVRVFGYDGASNSYTISASVN